MSGNSANGSKILSLFKKSISRNFGWLICVPVCWAWHTATVGGRAARPQAQTNDAQHNDGFSRDPHPLLFAIVSPGPARKVSALRQCFSRSCASTASPAATQNPAQKLHGELRSFGPSYCVGPGPTASLWRQRRPRNVLTDTRQIGEKGPMSV